MLGEFVLERAGAETRRFRYQKAASLLAYLALHRGRSASRDILIELLWPEEDPEVARNRFRVLLTSLRHQLEPPGVESGSVLVSHGNGLIQLNPEAVWTDVSAFEAAIRAGDNETALSLYPGELLPEFYDDWLIPERTRLAELAERIQEQSSSKPVAAPIQAPLGNTSSDQRVLPPTLPMPLTRFYGRDTEIQEIDILLSSFRLVTLTGPGGAGKTRLATEVARRKLDIFPDGVFFVALEDQFDPARILEAILAVLLSVPSGNGDIWATLVQRLQGRRVLLVLDNFEQLVAAGGGVLLERLLTTLPDLHCLVTSRRSLLIAGEREYPVAPLSIPPDYGNEVDLAALAQSPAVALFLDRAAAIRPDFTLTPGNAAAVTAICRTLEGLPLALELAAARLRAASPAQIRDGLARRFDLLARTERWVEKERRHSSLRLALDWGWRLLAPTHQQFFARLGIFRGGWTAEAAATITETPDATTALESLVADSLVRVEIRDEVARFRMLETLREFAIERLPSEDQAPLARCHAEYFRDFIEREDTRRYHASQSLAYTLQQLVPEMENLRAARDYFHATPDGAEDEARLVGTALFLWIHLGLTREAESFLTTALARYTEPTPVRAFLLYRGAWLAQLRGDGQTGRQYALECLSLYQAVGDPIGLSFGWNSLGNAEWFAGNLPAARIALGNAVTFGKQVRHPAFPNSQSYSDIPAANLGGVLLAQGEFAEAHTLLTELLERERSIGVRHGTGVFRNYILATEGLQRTAEVIELWREFLREALPNNNHFGVVEALEALARFAADAGQTTRAETLRAAAQTLRREANSPGAGALPVTASPIVAEAVRLALS